LRTPVRCRWRLSAGPSKRPLTRSTRPPIAPYNNLASTPLFDPRQHGRPLHLGIRRRIPARLAGSIRRRRLRPSPSLRQPTRRHRGRGRRRHSPDLRSRRPPGDARPSTVALGPRARRPRPPPALPHHQPRRARRPLTRLAPRTPTGPLSFHRLPGAAGTPPSGAPDQRHTHWYGLRNLIKAVSSPKGTQTETGRYRDKETGRFGGEIVPLGAVHAGEGGIVTRTVTRIT
jgi:hypothetical protein